MSEFGIISDSSSFMSNRFSYIICLVAFLALQCDKTTAQSEKKIFWSDSLELSWDFFKEKRSGYSYMKAITHSGIMYDVNEENGQMVIDIRAYFIYGKSWVIKGYKKPELLAHEQIHFHIAEIYKRKLDRLCDAYRVSYRQFVSRNYQKKLQADFDRIFNEMDAYQRKYDAETQHGTIKSKQDIWEKSVNKELGL